MILIEGATICTPDIRLNRGSVLLAEGAIQALNPSVVPEMATRIAAEGLILAPGFIDLQLNGAFGLDFTQTPATMWEVGRQLPQYGVTGFLPTIITSPAEAITAAQRVWQAGAPADFVGAAPLGLHLEGPFLNPAKKGAHNPDFMRRPCVDNWSPQTGVRLVTLAPELPQGLAVCQQLQQQGVVVSAGHTMATYEETMAALDAGVSYGTHLGNAMTPLHHRQPGVMTALMLDGRVTVGLIPDGVHLHPAMVQLVWQMVGERLNLVTDGMAALGMANGRYRLGDRDVIVMDGEARLADGTLAGSVLPLDEAVRNLIEYTGCELTEALATVTRTPAELLGLENYGRIGLGAKADLVLLSPDLEVVMTLIDGEIVYQDDDFYVK